MFGQKDFNITYSPLQLVHVIPLLRTAQQLRVVDEQASRILCLTAEHVEGESAKRLVAKRCFNDKGIHNWGKRDPDSSSEPLTQMFLTKLIPHDQLHDRSETKVLVGRSLHPQARLAPVLTMSVAQVTSYSDLPLLYDWYHAPFTHQREASGDSPIYPASLQCMAVYPAATSGAAAAAGGETGVVMETCDSHKSSQRVVLERSSTVAWVRFIRKHLEQWHYGLPLRGTNSSTSDLLPGS